MRLSLASGDGKMISGTARLHPFVLSCVVYQNGLMEMEPIRLEIRVLNKRPIS